MRFYDPCTYVHIKPHFPPPPPALFLSAPLVVRLYRQLMQNHILKYHLHYCTSNDNRVELSLRNYTDPGQAFDFKC